MTREPVGPVKRFAVVGGGMSGLAAAFHLEWAGHQVEVIESDAALGGRCGVGVLGDRPIMLGGKNIGRRYRELREFLAANGASAYEPFGINSSQVIGGKLVTLDNPGIAGLVRHLVRSGSRTDAVKMLYFGARVRFDERNRYLGSTSFARTAAAEDRVPLAAHFTPEFAGHVLRPITLRLNAAEPEEVFLGTFGVGLGMVMDRYDQLVDGIQPILDRIASRVLVRLRTRVDRIVCRDGRVIGLEISENDGSTTRFEYDGVVLATPAHAARLVVDHELPALGKLLADVTYFPSTVAVVQYDRPLFTGTVRSIAFDSGPCSAAGVYGINDLDIVRYTFSGRAARPQPDERQLAAWIDSAESRVRELLGTGPVAKLRTVTRSWPEAHCAYVPDHGEFLAKVREQADSIVGLELAGDYLLGAQLEACYRSGVAAATRLAG
ncbi:FAD-dependent oxidoreductase [Nocardia mexicana]|uniref:Oxygen-dependent protoporphyrinogen oxidase n=1 Tax=Nocardia mexicana TaxID=279262 RepID=A0A370GSY8_9NOCA|nr:FAD-dependent oxidoreductase [Nocardia mexicana]RDI46440.1 oxygen-dependent protoporphyrinogen oxidase [Nocardia mexicana]